MSSRRASVCTAAGAVALLFATSLVPASAATTVRVGAALFLAAGSEPSSSTVAAVACPVSGACVAAGAVTVAGNPAAVVQAQQGGSWGPAQFVGATVSNSAWTSLADVACASEGNCLAVGSFGDKDADDASTAMAVAEVGGEWQTPVVLDRTLAGDDNAMWASLVSCAAVGECVVVGGYGSDLGTPWVLEDRDGVLTAPETVPGWSSFTSGQGDVTSLSCAAGADCTLVGQVAQNGTTTGFIDSLTNGAWGEPTVALGGLGGPSILNSVSCPTVNDCTAVGTYESSATSDAYVGESLTETNGVWGAATAVISSFTGVNSVELSAVSCAAPGDCAVTGSVHSGAFDGDEVARVAPRGFEITGYEFLVDDELNGVWQTADIEGLDLNTGAGATGTAVSCASVGNCLATGYVDGDQDEAITVAETNGDWGANVTVARALGPTDATVGDVAACASSGACAVGGSWSNGTATYGWMAAESIPVPVNVRVIGSFGFDATSLTAVLRHQVQLAADYLAAHAASKVVVTGYTDNVGTTTSNRTVAAARAATVRVALLGALRNLGDDGVTVVAIGRGATNFVATNATAAGRAKNRRVTVRVVTAR